MQSCKQQRGQFDRFFETGIKKELKAGKVEQHSSVRVEAPKYR